MVGSGETVVPTIPCWRFAAPAGAREARSLDGIPEWRDCLRWKISVRKPAQAFDHRNLKGEVRRRAGGWGGGVQRGGALDIEPNQRSEEPDAHLAVPGVRLSQLLFEDVAPRPGVTLRAVQDRRGVSETTTFVSETTTVVSVGDMGTSSPSVGSVQSWYAELRPLRPKDIERLHGPRAVGQHGEVLRDAERPLVQVRLQVSAAVEPQDCDEHLANPVAEPGMQGAGWLSAASWSRSWKRASGAAHRTVAETSGPTWTPRYVAAPEMATAPHLGVRI